MEETNRIVANVAQNEQTISKFHDFFANYGTDTHFKRNVYFLFFFSHVRSHMIQKAPHVELTSSQENKMV